MMGVDVETMVSTLVPLGVDAVGFNCGTATLDQYVDLAGAFVQAVNTCARPVPIYAEPNAGKPQVEGDQAVYQVSPDQFAEALQRIYAKGIHILGGCCGTGPDHIRALGLLLKKRTGN
jgi:5-methyltetrahydrofolate--homocysteine methyltransferase